jgi:fibronectin-binding autotransporter adhesin
MHESPHVSGVLSQAGDCHAERIIRRVLRGSRIPRSPQPLLRPAWRLLAAAVALATTPAQAVVYTWSTGDFPGPASPTPPSTILATDVLDIVAGGTKRFVGGTFTNQGHVRWLADTLHGGDGAVVNNAGLWESFADTTLSYDFGRQPTFTNAHGGVLRKSGGTGSTSIGNWLFVNDGGVIDARLGTIDFDGSSNLFNDGTQFIGDGRVRVRNGATFSGGIRADNLVLAGGRFAGNSVVLSRAGLTTGGVTWSGGDMAGNWTLNLGGTFTVADGTAKRQVGGSIVNNGDFLWASGAAFQGGNSASFTNNALYQAEVSHVVSHNFGNANRFTNSAAATVRAAAGVTLTFSGVAFVNAGGVLEAREGASIVYGSGSARFENGTRFDGPSGTHVVSNSSRFIGAIQAASEVTLAGGTHIGGDGLSTRAQLLGRTFGWTSGDLQGEWEISADSLLTARNGAAKRQVGGTVVNAGTLVWNSTQAFQIGNGGSFIDTGLYEATAAHTIGPGTGGVGTFTVNGGEVRARFVTLTFGGVALRSNGGLFQTDGGSSIVFSGGNAVFGDGTRFMGMQQFVNSNATFVGAQEMAGLTVSAGTQTGGDGSAGSKATVNGFPTWSGGDLTGQWEIAGNVNVADGAAKRLVGGTIINNGRVEWASSDSFQVGGGGSFVNNGVYNALSSHAVTFNFGGANTFTNSDNAIVQASNGATLSFGRVRLVSNGGEFKADAGAAIVYGGGNALFNDGTVFTGGGMHRVSAASRFVGSIDANADVRLTGGRLTGGDGTAGSEAALRGGWGWTGGDLSGAWRNAGGTLDVADGAAKRQVGGTFVNDGTIRWASIEALQGGNAGTFTNNGTFEISTDADVTHAFGSRYSFVNQGVFVKTAGSGETSLATVALSNPGTIIARSGTIRLPNAFVNTGTLMGNGSFAAGVLSNQGHVAPGESPGTLTVVGNYVQAAGGSFDVDVNTLTNSDRLLVGGSATLAGTLALNCWGDCSLAAGESLVILDAVGDLGGRFAAVTLVNFGSGAFDVIYDTVDDRVLLVATQAVSALSGSAALASQLSRTVSPVPEPASWLLWLVAAAGAALRRKK